MAMMDNVNSFKALLAEDEIRYTENTFDDGDHVVKIPQQIKNVGLVNVVVLFTKHKVKVAMLGIASIEDEDKQLACCKLFSSFNMKYAFFKVYMREDGDVCVDADFSVELMDGEFQPKELMSFIAGEMMFVKDLYPEIMKIQWS